MIRQAGIGVAAALYGVLTVAQPVQTADVKDALTGYIGPTRYVSDLQPGAKQLDKGQSTPDLERHVSISQGEFRDIYHRIFRSKEDLFRFANQLIKDPMSSMYFLSTSPPPVIQACYNPNKDKSCDAVIKFTTKNFKYVPFPIITIENIVLLNEIHLEVSEPYIVLEAVFDADDNDELDGNDTTIRQRKGKIELIKHSKES